MNHSTPEPYAHPLQAQQPSMADLWNEFPQSTGTIAPAIAQRVAMHAPLAPLALQQLAASETVAGAEPEPRAPYTEPLVWMLAKHGMQVALVASVLLLVVSGGSSPILALAYVATGLMLMGILALTDRQLFIDADSSIELVEVAAPSHAPADHAAHHLFQQQHPQHQHLAALQAAYQHGVDPSSVVPPPFRTAPLSPLVEQMQVVMPDRVAVT